VLIDALLSELCSPYEVQSNTGHRSHETLDSAISIQATCSALKGDRQLEKDELPFEVTASRERQCKTDTDRCSIDCTEEKTDPAHWG
jgi:hypothetical protein